MPPAHLIKGFPRQCLTGVLGPGARAACQLAASQVMISPQFTHVCRQLFFFFTGSPGVSTCAFVRVAGQPEASPPSFCAHCLLDPQLVGPLLRQPRVRDHDDKCCNLPPGEVRGWIDSHVTPVLQPVPLALFRVCGCCW